MSAYGNGQRFLYHHGAGWQAHSYPDAFYGHRSAVSTRKGGGFDGYKIHGAVCTVTACRPRGESRRARGASRCTRHRCSARYALAASIRGTVAMDRGYDNNRVYDECRVRGIAPVIPLRNGRIQPDTPIKRGTPEWGAIYKRRTAVEREFGRLKHTYGLAMLRVRGIERVRLHADLTIMGRLALALAKTR
jgi:Transposase DDE domain